MVSHCQRLGRCSIARVSPVPMYKWRSCCSSWWPGPQKMRSRSRCSEICIFLHTSSVQATSLRTPVHSEAPVHRTRAVLSPNLCLPAHMHLSWCNVLVTIARNRTFVRVFRNGPGTASGVPPAPTPAEREPSHPDHHLLSRARVQPPQPPPRTPMNPANHNPRHRG